MKFKNSILVFTFVLVISFLPYAVTGKYGSCSRKFEVSAEKSFFKLWLYNTCGTRITYTVTKDTDYGEVAIGPYTL